MHLFYATKLLLDFIAIIINKLLDYICINNRYRYQALRLHFFPYSMLFSSEISDSGFGDQGHLFESSTECVRKLSTQRDWYCDLLLHH